MFNTFAWLTLGLPPSLRASDSSRPQGKGYVRAPFNNSAPGGGRGGGAGAATGGQQKAATRRNMRREERVTVQGPVKEQQPDGMSHRGSRFPVICEFAACEASLCM